MYGYFEVSRRAMFVLNTTGVVIYVWVRDGDNPEFESLVDEVAAAAGAV